MSTNNTFAATNFNSPRISHSGWDDPSTQEDILGIVRDIWELRPVPFLDLVTSLQNKFWNKFTPGELRIALLDYYAQLEKENGNDR